MSRVRVAVLPLAGAILAAALAPRPDPDGPRAPSSDAYVTNVDAPTISQYVTGEDGRLAPRATPYHAHHHAQQPAHAGVRHRFDGPGETLLGVYRGGELIAVGGLTRDPYDAEPRAGRVRRVYVRRADAPRTAAYCASAGAGAVAADAGRRRHRRRRILAALAAALLVGPPGEEDAPYVEYAWATGASTPGHGYHIF